MIPTQSCIAYLCEACTYVPMADPTMRDKVWMHAYNQIVRKDKPMKPSDIAEYAGVSERMARQALLVIADSGMIRRKKKPDGKVTYICEEGISVDEERNLDASMSR